MVRVLDAALLALAGAILLLGGSTAPLVAAPEMVSAVISPHNTRIGFVINGIGWPQTRGSFQAFTGHLEVDFANPARSHVDVTIKAASVDAGGSSITDYIKSSSMLDVVKHPIMSFRSTAVRRTGPATVALSGQMSFFGAIRPATFIVRILSKPGHRPLAFVATGAIQRSAFGFNSGQPIISDTAQINISSKGPGL